MSDIDQELALIIKSKPWLHPELEPQSYWVVTSFEEQGYVLDGGNPLVRTTLIDCLCYVSYDSGSAVFVGPNSTFVAPADVARAVPVLIVREDDPTRAAYPHDQAAVDAANERSAQ